MARVRFPVARTRDKSAAGAYVAIVPDERFPGMYRLKRTDGSLSDMVNLTRAKDALAAIHRHSPRDHSLAVRFESLQTILEKWVQP